ncbi:hypothetical protein ACE1B6_08475 [Aerosakkonemataceae cyanobacterium BLCC-F154]|uniref:Translation initiation factor IF-2 n=1 Tax=Floridaenema fluviatile BLCC-F154 TaxID=3153640 RepID=A0ABV4Y903_9CYAN
MGFANLSIAEIAADYDTAVTEVLQICDRLGIPYKNPQTQLALEDAKAIISAIMAHSQESDTNRQEDIFSENQNLASLAGDVDPGTSSEPESPSKP